MLTLIPNFSPRMAAPELDAVIVEGKVFQATETPFSLMFVREIADLPYLLHQAQMDEESWWNVFDEIQLVHIQEGLPLTLEDLAIPEQYQPLFVFPSVNYYEDGRKVLEVRFHQAGFIWQVVHFTDKGRQVDQYDERGFLSTQTWYDTDQQFTRKVWWSPLGIKIMTQTEDGIDIEPTEILRFAEHHYDSLNAIIAEVVTKHLAKDASPHVIANATGWLSGLRSQLPGKLSINYLVPQEASPDVIAAGGLTAKDHLIMPTQADLTLFKRQVASQRPDLVQAVHAQSHVIALFPTSLKLGISNEMPQMIIYWQLGGAAEGAVRQLFDRFLGMLRKDPEKALMIEGDQGLLATLKQRLTDYVTAEYAVTLDSKEYQAIADYLDAKRQGNPVPLFGDALKKVKASKAWHPANEAFSYLQRVNFTAPLSFAKRQKHLQTARIYVDTNDVPDLRTQTAVVSAGIPQIVRAANDLLINGKNGALIGQLDEIPEHVRHYLDILRNWNEAVVANVGLIDTYTVERIKQEWQEVL